MIPLYLTGITGKPTPRKGSLDTIGVMDSGYLYCNLGAHMEKNFINLRPNTKDIKFAHPSGWFISEYMNWNLGFVGSDNLEWDYVYWVG